MPKFEEYKCPVCGQQFHNDDDVVTCPDCGTPHHRHCYEMTGHCVNKGLHSAGYDYYEDNKPAIPKKEDGANTEGQYYIPPAEKDNNQQNDQPRVFVMPMAPIHEDNTYDKDSDTIDGYKVSDYAAAIRANVPRFITKFKQMAETKKKLSWNWGAFFFGSFYMLFRKMYKQGITFLLLSFTSYLGGITLALKKAPMFAQAVQDMAASIQSGSVENLDTTALLNASDYAVAQKYAFITMAVLLVIRIVVTVFSDYFYKGTVTSIIKRVNDEIEKGASFMQTSVFPVDDDSLTQEQMRRMYLARMGGVSFFAPFAAYFALYLLMTII